MRRRLLAGFLLFALVLVTALEVPLGFSLASNERNTALSGLQRDATSLSLLISGALEQGDVAHAQAVATRYAGAVGGILALVNGGRALLVAGRNVTEELRDPQTRAIIAQASGGRVSGEKGSNDRDDDFLYVALPIASVGDRIDESPTGSSAPATTALVPAAAGTIKARPAAVLIVAAPAGPVNARIARDWLKLAVFGLAALVLAAIVGALLARSLTRPLASIEAAVAAIGAGDLSERARGERGPDELRNLAGTVNEMADRLEELLRSQRAFVADASHQLRAPMTALRLRLENLEATLGPPGAADLSATVAEADRLSHIVDGLLALARAEGTRPVRESTDVAEVVRERAAAWRALAEERNITIVDEEPGGEPGQSQAASWALAPLATRRLDALACPGHLEQVLDNLLANALEATPEGGTVTLATGRRAGSVEIHVVDTGPGMSTAERVRAFDRFWRPEGAHGEGTGLGLAIVAQLVRVSGGAAELRAGPGGGIDAVVELEAC